MEVTRLRTSSITTSPSPPSSNSLLDWGRDTRDGDTEGEGNGLG